MTGSTVKKRQELIELIMAKGAYPPKRSRVEATVYELGEKEISDLLQEWRAKRSERVLFERPTAAATVLQKLLDRSDFEAINLDPDDDPLDVFADHLEQENGIRVRDDGRIEFRHLTTDNRELIDDLPVVVCHYTASTLVESIRHNGLIPGFIKTNPHRNSYSGVYVTTEWSGPVVVGYCRVACAAHGGHPIRIEIEAFIHQLHPDDDDADLSSGRLQFAMSGVRPAQIIEISSF